MCKHENMGFKILKWRLPLSKKFLYNDTWSIPEIYIDNNISFVTDHLGFPNPQLDPKKYHWGSVKLRKGETWNKNSFLHKVDQEYMFSSIRFYNATPDLYIQFKCGNGWGFEIVPIDTLSRELQEHIREYLSAWSQFNRLSQIVFRYKQPAIYLTIKNYKQRTYYELVSELRGFGRHFEDGLLEIRRETL